MNSKKPAVYIHYGAQAETYSVITEFLENIPIDFSIEYTDSCITKTILDFINFFLYIVLAYNKYNVV